MRALDKKLLRDFAQLKGQALTIALVVAAGIGVFVGFQSVYGSLIYSRDVYYERYRFADVFAGVERAPEQLKSRIEAIPGVAQVYTRLRYPARFLIADLPQPPVGLLASLPDDGAPPLNALHLVTGRLPTPGQGEALVLASFAEKRGLVLGEPLVAIVDGNACTFRITGTVLSPEFVYPMGAGEILPDDERFLVLWAPRNELAAMLKLTGAFNDLAVALQPLAHPRQVLTELDQLLAPYGGRGAYDRALQPSNNVLEGELYQLRTLALAVPMVFLSVAAFLLNVVLSRLVHLQRSQIAALKAVGYSNLQVGLHYLELVSVMVLVGSGLGIAFGAWFGRALHDLYGQFFRFPVQLYHLEGRLILTAVGVSLVAGVLGALVAVRAVVQLPPAEAMRPAAPLAYRRSVLERLGITGWVSPAFRMVTRELTRRPLRTSLSVLGIALSVGVLILGRFNADLTNGLMDLLFQRMWREDLLVAFAGPRPERAIRELAHLPGVIQAEGLRVVPVRMRAGPRQRDVVLYGYQVDGELRRPVSLDGRPLALPERGALVTQNLLEILQVAPGEEVEIELREGSYAKKRLRIAGPIEDAAGLAGHLRADTLAQVLGEEPLVSLALLTVASRDTRDLERRLQAMPQVLNVSAHATLVDRFEKQSAESIRVMTLFATIFAITIAVGVVYNNARVALSLRERDLASLRVLGLTRREISAILLGELAIQVILALPFGFWIGRAMAQGIAATVDPERFRFPMVIETQTYAFAAIVTLAAGLASGLLVRRKLDRLDLIAVLKTRE